MASMKEIFTDWRRGILESRLAECAKTTGCHFDGNGLVIPFYNMTYRVSPGAVEDPQGRPPTDAVGLVLCRYVLRCPPSAPPDGRLVTFRELPGAGPLVSSFTRNTNKLIASAFARDPGSLTARSSALSGEVQADPDGWDVSVRFAALPGVPLFLKFNADDSMFPAQSSLLFYQSAERYLDMQTLFILGTWLAGSLIS